MSTKYFYVYISLGVIFLLASIYELVTESRVTSGVYYDLLVCFILFYLAYKVYKNKKDQELM